MIVLPIEKNVKCCEIKLKVSFEGQVKKNELVQISSSRDSERLLREVFNGDTFQWKEEFILLCLNTNNRVIGFFKVSNGGITSTVVDTRIIFSVALNCLATQIIVAHNHPSGNIKPSEADIKLTEKIANAGKILDIKLLDHIILADNMYYSFADEGRI